MVQQDVTRPPWARLLEEIDTGPKRAPDTDPTNPYHEEAAGEWARAEAVSVWKVDEPGLTDHDRWLRDWMYCSSVPGKS